LNYAKMLRPELEAIDGFVDNTRYRSLTREGWILSLSSWRDEKSLIRWRTKVDHHSVQERGRTVVLSDYHLRVGQVTHDSRIPEGYALQEQRLDETDVGEGTTVMLIDAQRTGGNPMNDPVDYAEWLGLPPFVGVLSWDIFDAVLTPGDYVGMLTWRDSAAAQAFESSIKVPEAMRLRRIRIVRDYGMYDRREAPQYYPDVPGRETIHS
jgi:heme-degrading monooxygenase HmoA